MRRIALIFAALIAAIPLSVQADSVPNQTLAIAAGTSANTVVSANPGRVYLVLVTTSGSNAFVCFDNATTNSGTIVVDIPANAAVDSYPVNLPLKNGLTCAGNAANPAVTIGYSN